MLLSSIIFFVAEDDERLLMAQGIIVSVWCWKRCRPHKLYTSPSCRDVLQGKHTSSSVYNEQQTVCSLQRRRSGSPYIFACVSFTGTNISLFPLSSVKKLGSRRSLHLSVVGGFLRMKLCFAVDYNEQKSFILVATKTKHEAIAIKLQTTEWWWVLRRNGSNFTALSSIIFFYPRGRWKIADDARDHCFCFLLLRRCGSPTLHLSVVWGFLRMKRCFTFDYNEQNSFILVATNTKHKKIAGKLHTTDRCLIQRPSKYSQEGRGQTSHVGSVFLSHFIACFPSSVEKWWRLKRAQIQLVFSIIFAKVDEERQKGRRWRTIAALFCWKTRRPHRHRSPSYEVFGRKTMFHVQLQRAKELYTSPLFKVTYDG